MMDIAKCIIRVCLGWTTTRERVRLRVRLRVLDPCRVQRPRLEGAGDLAYDVVACDGGSTYLYSFLEMLIARVVRLWDFERATAKKTT